MGFLDILKEMVDNVKGGTAGTIMARDGIAIQNYVKGQSGCDMDSLGVEYSRILSEVKNASSVLSLGQLEEISISAESSAVIIRLINDDYFIAIVLNPEGNMGKARYLLRKTVAKVKKEF